MTPRVPGAPAVAFVTGFLMPMPLAAASGEGDFSMAAALFQMLGALLLVIGLILLVQRLLRRWGGGGPLASGRRYIRVVDIRHVAPRHSLILLEVGGKYLLVGSSPQGFVFLREIDMLEEIEIVGEGNAPWERIGSLNFRDVLVRMTGRRGEP